MKEKASVWKREGERGERSKCLSVISKERRREREKRRARLACFRRDMTPRSRPHIQETLEHQKENWRENLRIKVLCLWDCRINVGVWFKKIFIPYTYYELPMARLIFQMYVKTKNHNATAKEENAKGGNLRQTGVIDKWFLFSDRRENIWAQTINANAMGKYRMSLSLLYTHAHQTGPVNMPGMRARERTEGTFLINAPRAGQMGIVVLSFAAVENEELISNWGVPDRQTDRLTLWQHMFTRTWIVSQARSSATKKGPLVVRRIISPLPNWMIIVLRWTVLANCIWD